MYARFVTLLRHRESDHPLGVIRASLWFDHRIRSADQRKIEELVDWFNAYLPVPRRFVRNRDREGRKNAICWFKPCAERFLEKVQQIAEILERNRITTELWRTRKPGYVVYEDAYQVAAVPFRDTMVVTPKHRAAVRFRFVRHANAVGPVLSRAS